MLDMEWDYSADLGSDLKDLSDLLDLYVAIETTEKKNEPFELLKTSIEELLVISRELPVTILNLAPTLIRVAVKFLTRILVEVNRFNKLQTQLVNRVAGLSFLTRVLLG